MRLVADMCATGVKKTRDISLARCVGGQCDVGEAFAAGVQQIARYDAAVIHADDRAAGTFGEHVVGNQSRAGSARDGDADAESGSPHEVSGGGDIAEILTVAENYAGEGRVLDRIAGDGAVRFDGDADAGAVIGIGARWALRKQVADQIALDDREPSAVIEIGNGDSDGGAIDAVAGDDGALEAEFGIKRDLAHIRHGIAFDMQVRGRIAAHGREGAIRDTIAAYDDIAGAKDIDGVAILAGTAGAVGNILDTVTGDDGAVVTFLASPNLNAVIGRACDSVA